MSNLNSASRKSEKQCTALQGLARHTTHKKLDSIVKNESIFFVKVIKSLKAF
jgi:hypothetical protein